MYNKIVFLKLINLINLKKHNFIVYTLVFHSIIFFFSCSDKEIYEKVKKKKIQESMIGIFGFNNNNQ